MHDYQSDYIKELEKDNKRLSDKLIALGYKSFVDENKRPESSATKILTNEEFNIELAKVLARVEHERLKRAVS